MTPLQKILATYRTSAQSEKEKGTYFEELIRTYFRFEATSADLYSDVWLYSGWAKEIDGPEFGMSGKDTGIDLVAKIRGTEEYHAIQCKCYAEAYTVKKADIDSFFTASGQKPFTLRYIVTTTNGWSDNASNSLHSQTPPVYKIDLLALETSQIDWAKYQPTAAAPVLKSKKELRLHQTSAKGLTIAEEVAGKDKRVLFLVPSLNLLSQTLTEWPQESAIPLHSFAVCSDVEVGKKRHDAQYMSVVFSIYHSLDVISRAQYLHGLPPFDLVICDDAKKTGRRARPRLQAVRTATRISLANQRDPRWNVGTLKRVVANKTYRTFNFAPPRTAVVEFS